MAWLLDWITWSFLFDQLIDWLIDWLLLSTEINSGLWLDCLIEWLAVFCLINRLIDWLIDVLALDRAEMHLLRCRGMQRCVFSGKIPSGTPSPSHKPENNNSSQLTHLLIKYAFQIRLRRRPQRVENMIQLIQVCRTNRERVTPTAAYARGMVQGIGIFSTVPRQQNSRSPSRTIAPHTLRRRK